MPFTLSELKAKESPLSLFLLNSIAVSKTLPTFALLKYKTHNRYCRFMRTFNSNPICW